MTEQTRTDDQALDSAFKSYLECRTPDYDPRATIHHFDGFRVFADGVIGDALRKVKDHLFPKVEATGADGISIGNVSILPHRSHEGKAHELVVRTDGIDRFVLRTLRTPAGHGRNRPTDTVVVLRAGARLGITHASMLAPDESHNWWRYKVHDGPGVIPGLVEACELVLPFISAEAAADTVSRDLDAAYAPEYMDLVERDGGLPGKLVAQFGERVIADGMGAIFDWLAKELPALAAKIGDRMTWPENSLHYNDQDESAAILRAPGAIGIAQFIGPAVADPNYAEVQVLRVDDNGTPRRAETYMIPMGEGELVRALDAFRAGEPLGDHLSMTFDFDARSVSTSAAFLEAKGYHDVGSTVFHVNIDWKGRREENFVEGVDRFREYDGLNVSSRCTSPTTPTL
ncbi:hypothetical protein OIU34_21145 [Pararhizobium sp. BT-229]|uniref:hypothetical protein n=1 Tax=Pararhizobium sp. BT-229 TaxID=2986923 RepID=UPI0021F7A02C|nr:hypothetical protein [Pararhizobium sp. BT-229]MCV9964398.1 hypothetical protein [Pararhizobium sp. BT-229]